MAAFFIYLLKVLVCSAIFAGCYWWVLRNRRFHQWNRFYIMASILLSIFIPILSIPVPAPDITFSVTNSYIPKSVLTLATVPDVTHTSGISQFTWSWFGLAAYLSVVFLLLWRKFYFFTRILRIKHHAERVIMQDLKLYYTDDTTAPFTFFRTVFWRKNDPVDSGEGSCMFRHELAHVRLGHSWDKTLMQLACCLFWINPFFLLFRRELEIVHEFAADSESINEGDTQNLSSLILYTLYPKNYLDFISRFFQSPIKRRIIMITKNKTQKSMTDMLRKMSIVPLVMIALYAFSIRPTDTPTGKSKALAGAALQDPWTSQNELEEKVIVVGYASENVTPKQEVIVTRENERKIAPGAISFTDVEQKPVFQDGINNYLRFIADRIGYPTIAMENGITGMVVVSFVIDKDGNVTDVKSPVKIDNLSREAERVIKLLPAWKPGTQGGKAVAVQCYLFVEFKLQT